MERAGLFLCVCVCAGLAGVLGQVASLCRSNERFLSCGGCQKTCENPAPACAAVCRTGCYCEPDQVRNGTGHCIPLAECPPISEYKLDTSEPRAECPPNEEYRFCEPCNRTCDNPNPICPAQCTRGCFCRDDLLRDRNGSCVEFGKCPKVVKNESSNHVIPIPLKLACEAGQVFKECEPCEKSCHNPNPLCPAQCSRGCFCEEGLLRAPSGKCVKPENCPKAEVTFSAVDPSIEDCAPDEEFLACGWCEPSCWEPAPSCPRVCTRGCLCRPPLLRHHSGLCVERAKCEPQKCVSPNEEFVCRYGCESRCGASTCAERPRRCQLGCHCRLGLLRDTVSGRCITPEECQNKGSPALPWKRVTFSEDLNTLAKVKLLIGHSDTV